MDVLETERLRLRPFAAEDAEAMFTILGDREAMRFYPNPFSREDSDGWVRRQLTAYEDRGFGLSVVEDKLSGEFLGDAGPTLMPVEDKFFVELGWHVRRDRWGRGIATEAGIAWRDWCWANLEVDRLISLVRPENVASCRVAEKIGMRVWRETMHADLRHYVYSTKRS